MGPVRAGVVADDAQHGVVFGTGAVGSVLRREVRRVEEDQAQLRRDVRGERLEIALGVAERPALGLQRLGAGDVTRLAQRADLTGQGLDPVADLVALGDGVTFAPVEPDGAIDFSRIDTTASQRGLDAFRISAQTADVDHER